MVAEIGPAVAFDGGDAPTAVAPVGSWLRTGASLRIVVPSGMVDSVRAAT
jgi:hypothetical protein